MMKSQRPSEAADLSGESRLLYELLADRIDRLERLINWSRLITLLMFGAIAWELSQLFGRGH